MSSGTEEASNRWGAYRREEALPRVLRCGAQRGEGYLLPGSSWVQSQQLGPSGVVATAWPLHGEAVRCWLTDPGWVGPLVLSGGRRGKAHRLSPALHPQAVRRR
ncbi:hypothetical protein NDU88_006725 [Pleurodeles waltl]|uniref:Uncharacterized protein n=1 Tax=Pleurodeles waltl TaxID=8319 RepID=A0AAV7MGK7_PLEWA|nr:hypothetical protein NDU88_006725 [Pleurodeles waltl]